MRKDLIKEINVIRRPARAVTWRVGLVYPNSYSVGMSGLSIKLLYHLLNQHQQVFTERIFKPREPFLIPKSLETQKSLNNFDILMFSFQFELDYINAIKMLHQSKIPLYTKDRRCLQPLLIAGGPAITANPEPILEVFDLVFIGEFESVAENFIKTLIDSEHTSLDESIASIPGFHDINSYSESVKPLITPHLDAVNYPTAQVRPISHNLKKSGTLDGFFLQVSRGCPHGCHYCLISKIFRPHRERSLNKLEEIILEGKNRTKTNYFSLIGSSTADYSRINELLNFFNDNKLRFTLPSIRVDSGKDLLESLNRSGQKSLTIAPEAGSDDTRYSVGKRITNEEIVSFASRASTNNIRNLKAYFILGLTPEPMKELQEIDNLVKELKHSVPAMKYKISLTPLIPKKHTRFGNSCINYEAITLAYKAMKKNITKSAPYKIFPIRWAVIQAILSVGGREITPIMVDIASQGGGSYQSWKKKLNNDPMKFYKNNYCKDEV
ncbi:MAG: radical SAM protein [Candidatus Heimdallarchaeota archaeon]|nr:radical SAM protein [Candidatus Heimdallarchaeota archaeon]